MENMSGLPGCKVDLISMSLSNSFWVSKNSHSFGCMGLNWSSIWEKVSGRFRVSFELVSVSSSMACALEPFTSRDEVKYLDSSVFLKNSLT